VPAVEAGSDTEGAIDMAVASAQGIISTSQAVTADAVSTNAIDLHSLPPAAEIGAGFAMLVTSAADITTGDETYTFEIIGSAVVGLTSPTIAASFTVLARQLVVGAVLFFPLPAGQPKLASGVALRYLGMNYNVGGTTPSVGVTTWFTSRAVFDILTELSQKNWIDA
jgi:hypothetical protein